MNISIFRTAMFACITLIACSPTESKLEAFGKASDAAVSLVAIPAQLSGSTLSDAEVNRNHCRYVRGNKYELAATPSQKPSKLVLQQANVAKALSAYSKALAGALSSEEEKALREAGAGLAGELGTTATTLGASPEVPEILNLLTSAILRIDANRRLADIKAEMDTVLPYLIVLETRLREDAKTVDAEMERRILDWERQARCVLSVSHRNDPTTRALFLEFDETKRKLEADRRKASKAADGVAKLIEAHFVVLGDKGTLEEGLDILNGFIGQIEAIKDA